MDPARWERVQELFHRVVDLPQSERAERLRADGVEPGLAAEVLALATAGDTRGTLLEREVADLAKDVVGPSAKAAFPGRVGPYDLRGVLGEGGMGTVLLAERRDVGGLVALKLLRDAWLSPARRERFVIEQRTLAQLVHPAIAHLHDAGALPDGTPWFAMEYVQGLPLTEYCRLHGTSIEGRLELVRRVCEAVQYAHAQAVIHRDLKPSNVLVKADGSVKLLDFGIAKHLEGAAPGSDPTRTGLRLLTLAYAAPEQYRGERVDIRTDIYSLGVILYELLTLRLPFDLAELQPAEAVAKLLAGHPPPPSAVARQAAREAARAGRIPHESPPRSRRSRRTSWTELDVLCAKAMHADPERRYPTVDALMRDIERFLAGEPLDARRDAVGYRLRKLVQRHRTAVTILASLFVTIVLLVVFYTRRLSRARYEAEAWAGRTARIQGFLLNLFAGGDPEAGPADDLRVVTLLENSVAEARSLDADPLLQAELFRTLGEIFQKLGRFDEADTLLSSALERQRALLPAGDPELALSTVALGLLRAEQGRLEEAESLVRAAFELLRSTPAEQSHVGLRAALALGQVLEARGKYAEAIEIGESSVKWRDRGAAPEPDDLTALAQLADSHYYAGHYALADSLNQELLGWTRKLYGVRHPRVADILVNLGASQNDRGRYAEAEQLFRSALEILADFYGPEHFRTASGMTMLGRSLVYQQEFSEGVPLLREALAIQERVNGPIHARVASALNDLGSAALQEGRLDEAQRDFERMLAIYRAIYGDSHSLLGTALSNLASVLTKKGDLEQAEALYREAIATFERTLSPEHVSTGIGRIKLGHCLLRQERPAEAEIETLAGYRILASRAEPAVSWLRSAREDLVREYELLGQPEQAALHRAEQQRLESSR